MTTLFERDQKTIWHPFTQHKTSPLPLPIARGEGAYLFDTAGKSYLDLISSWWVTIHGHAQPAIAKAIYEQALKLEQVIFAGFTHEPAVVLAEKLLALLPSGFSKVFYSDNGSTSVEVALKMAYQFWRNQGQPRQRFLAFSGGYHGDTFGAMSVGQSSKYYQAFSELLFAVDFAPFPATWHGDELCAEKEKEALRWIEAYLSQYGHETAAIILEPLIQAANGMPMCRPELLRALEE
jgi:adenosylmethionine-8-amino-7-oxononanoate aminotransferase